jgi:hypothetical protein
MIGFPLGVRGGMARSFSTPFGVTSVGGPLLSQQLNFVTIPIIGPVQTPQPDRALLSSEGSQTGRTAE